MNTKVILFALLATMVVAGTFQIANSARTVEAETTARVQPMGSLGGNAARVAARYEDLKTALIGLSSVKSTLEDAQLVFGGHRGKAIAAAEQAIGEVKAAIATRPQFIKN